MGDLLRQGMTWLAQQLNQHCASPVEYRRGDDLFFMNATFGRTDIELADESGLTITGHVWDFLILTDDLGFDPEASDVIAADGRKYEVMNLGGDGPWRFSDPYRTTLRIHTKDIGVDT